MSITVDPIRLELLKNFELCQSSHDAPGDASDPKAACAMEMAAWLAGESWSDHPECVSPTITSFVQRLNDAWGTQDRQRLIDYIPRMIGTRGSDRLEETRSYMAVDWLVRTYVPAWLDLANRHAHAAESAAAALSVAKSAALSAALYVALCELKPTVTTLQASALDLLDRMIAAADPA